MDIGHAVRNVFLGMPTLLTGGIPGARAGDERLAYSHIDAPETLTIASDAFEAGDTIPRRYTADWDNISPPLKWSAMPAETASVVLMVEDPDAPTPNPFVHWMVYNLAPATRTLPEGIAPPPNKFDQPEGFMQGKNSTLRLGYTGAAPPRGDLPHHYHFQLFALDKVLETAPGAGRSELSKAMKGHVLAKGRLIGVYQR